MPVVFAELKATISEFQARMGEARAEMESTQKKGESAFGSLHSFATAALAGLAAGAVSAGVAAVHLADEYETSHARLVTALDNTGSSFDAFRHQIEQAETQGEKFGYTNAQIEDALSRLEIAVKNPAVALKDLGVAEDIAAARGLDLNTASQLVARAANGSYTALVKLGVVTKAQAKDFHDGAEAVNFLAGAFKGEAQAQAETFGGKLHALEATAADVGKTIGLWLIPKIEAVATALQDGIRWIEKHKTLVEILGGVIVSVLVPALAIWAAAQAAAFASAAATAVANYIVMIGNLAREFTAMGLAADVALGPLGMIGAAIAAMLIHGDDIPKQAKAWGDAFVQNLGPGVDQVRALTAEEDRLAQRLRELAAMPRMTDAQSKEYGTLADQLAAVDQKLKAAKTSQDAHNQSQKDAAQVTAQLGGAEEVTKSRTQELADAMKQEKEAVSQLSTMLDELIGKHVSADRAAITFQNDLDALTKSVAQNGKTIDLNSEAGRKNRAMLDSAVEGALKNAEAIARETGNGDLATQTFQANIQQLIGVAQKAGITGAAFDNLVAQEGLLNPDISQAIHEAATASVTVDISGLHIPVLGLAAGGVTRGPALVGEGNRSYPEWVVPSDPAHRANAMALYSSLGAALGVRAMAAGGILGGSASGPIGFGTAAADITRMMVPLFNQAIPQAIGQGVQQAFGSAQFGQTLAGALGSRLAATAGFTGGGGAGQWAGVAAQVAMMLGQPGSVGAILRRIQFESGGDPFSVNRSDINFLMGMPSVGLAQVIGPTFAAYAGQFRNVGPFAYGVSENPLANVFAGMNYATSRYGSIAAVDPRVMPSGYDQGGWLMPGVTMAYNGTGSPERVLPPGGGGGGVVVNVTVNGNVIGQGGMTQLAQTVRDEILRGKRGYGNAGLA